MFLLASLGTVPMALLRRRLDFRRLSTIEISGAAVRALTSLVLAAAAGLDGAALVIGALAGMIKFGTLSLYSLKLGIFSVTE